MHSTEQLVALAGRYGLTLDARTVRTTSSGLDFLVAFASDADGVNWVLRVPRRPDALDRTRKERPVLDLVAQHLPVQVPRWEICSDELIAYRQLDGLPVGTIDMEAKAYVWRIDEKNVPPVLEQTLAEAMAALHAIDPAEAAAAGLRVLTPGELRPHMHARMLRARAEFGVGKALWRRWRDWLGDDSYWPEHVALVHGDLHPGHILIDETARVTGIIDWTETAVGDPAIDFAGHRTTFGDDALRRLISAYEDAGGRVWPRMFDHIVELGHTCGVTVAEFALSSGLDEYRQMARQCLGVAD